MIGKRDEQMEEKYDKRLEFTCCICGKLDYGWGNDPRPLTEWDGKPIGPLDRCCDHCNKEVVVAERIRRMKQYGKW